MPRTPLEKRRQAHFCLSAVKGRNYSGYKHNINMTVALSGLKINVDVLKRIDNRIMEAALTGPVLLSPII